MLIAKTYLVLIRMGIVAKIQRIVVYFIFSVTLTGCTYFSSSQTPSESPKKIAWEQRKLALSAIQNWKLNGKVAVQTTRDSGSASFNWMQNNTHYVITLMGPLGTHRMELSGRKGNIVLETNGKHFYARSPEQLLAKQWGFKLPVSSLKYWIRGIPVPGIPAETHFDRYGRLRQLQQEGWNIQFLAYKHLQAKDLPSKLYITSPSLKVRIMIYDWEV